MPRIPAGISLLHLPGVRLLLPLIAGIVLADLIPGNHVRFWVLLPTMITIVPLVAFKGRFRYRFLPGIAAVSGLLLCGVTLRLTDSEDDTPASLADRELPSLCIVEEAAVPLARSVKVSCSIFDSIGTPTESRGILYLEPSSAANDLLPGDQLALNITWQEVRGPLNPQEFDLRAFYAERDIRYTAFADSSSWTLVKGPDKRSVRRLAAILRKLAIAQLRNAGTRDDLMPLAAAMFLGDRSLLGADITDTYARAGVIHILCVSGMHAGIIFLVLGNLASAIGISRRRHGIRLLILLPGLWSYAILTGLSPSVIRAATMLTVVSFGRALNRNSDNRGMLALAVFILLVWDTALFYRTGFRLSVLAVLGILELQRILSGALYGVRGLRRKIISMTGVALSAQAFTAPLAVYVFHRFPNYFLISNLLVLPIASVVMWLGVGVLSFAGIPLVGSIFSWSLNLCLSGMHHLVVFLAALPYAASDRLYLSGIQVVLLYAVLYQAVSFLHRHEGRRLIISGVLVSLFILPSLQRHYENLNRDEIWVYSLGSDIGIDVMRGHEAIFLHSIREERVRYKVNWHIEPGRIKCSIDDSREQGDAFPRDTLVRYRIGNRKLEALQLGKLAYSNRLKVVATGDLLIIGGYRFPDTLVIGGSARKLVFTGSPGDFILDLETRPSPELHWLGTDGALCLASQSK